MRRTCSLLFAAIVAACAADEAPTVSSVCAAYCAREERCWETSFDDQYESQRECREGCEERLPADLDEHSACGEEGLAYEACLAELPCDEYEAFDYSGCAEESETFDACHEEAYPDCVDAAVAEHHDEMLDCQDGCGSQDCYDACEKSFCAALEELGCDEDDYGCGG